MLLLMILILIVVSIISYFFFAPLYLEIDTTKGLYRIRFHRLASFSLELLDSAFAVEVKLAGFTKKINPLEFKKKPDRKPMSAAKRKTGTYRICWKKLKGVLYSFKVNKCSITIDFGDMQLNGVLYPLFYWTGRYFDKDVGINFMNENKVILEIENSLARMSWAYLSS